MSTFRRSDVLFKSFLYVHSFPSLRIYLESMKKKTVVTNVVTNLLLVSILGILAAFCLSGEEDRTAFRPYYKGTAETSRVGIMINVYEGSAYVEKILDILDKNDAVCTFFIGGVWAEKNTALLQRMARQAEIGNHGYLHRDHKTIGKKANEDELILCHELVRKVTGIEMDLFAPPSGSFGQETLDCCEKHGYKVIMWSKDTIDWRDRDETLIYKRATQDVSGGDLILMHPTEQTVRALPKILAYYKAHGLLPSIVSDMISV